MRTNSITKKEFKMKFPGGYSGIGSGHNEKFSKDKDFMRRKERRILNRFYKFCME